MFITWHLKDLQRVDYGNIYCNFDVRNICFIVIWRKTKKEHMEPQTGIIVVRVADVRRHTIII